MHELGIVFYILDEVKKITKENHTSHINSVTLEIGEVSTVIPSYLEDCWKWAIGKDDITKNCQLKIEKVQAITYCKNCGNRFETIKNGKVCPKCSSSDTYLIQGDEVNIKEIEVI